MSAVITQGPQCLTRDRWLADVTKRAACTRVGEIMLASGFKLHPTGGCCLAWRIEALDGAYCLITTYDGEAGFADTAPEAHDWIAAWYDDARELATGKVTFGLTAAIVWCQLATASPRNYVGDIA